MSQELLFSHLRDKIQNPFETIIAIPPPAAAGMAGAGGEGMTGSVPSQLQHPPSSGNPAEQRLYPAVMGTWMLISTDGFLRGHPQTDADHIGAAKGLQAGHDLVALAKKEILSG